MTNEKISHLIGTNRQTVTRLLSEFRRNAMAKLKHLVRESESDNPMARIAP